MWKCLNKEYLVDTEWLKVRKDLILINDEDQIDYYVTEKNDVVLIVALNEKNDVILIDEYKYPIDRIMTQLPAGTLTRGKEEPFDTAKRELREETGCVSDDWELMAETYDYTTKDTHKVFLYLARNCVKISEQNLDKYEDISFKWVSFKKAVDLVISNEISTNSAANALLRCAIMYPELLG